MFKADLHCHSYFSDGTDTPMQLVDLAISSGLSALSITDHDTVASYPAVLEYAKKKQFLVLPGVEFSASYEKEPVHVLGYHFSIESPVILQFCQFHTKRRKERNAQILDNLAKLGMKIAPEELTGRGSSGRPHIALALVKRGFVKSVKEAFDLYLGEGKKAYDPGEKVSVSETIDVIHQGGGKAILAHPHLLIRTKTIKYLLSLPLDGLEAYYANMPLSTAQKWIEIAEGKKWLITGGSDYHGSVKPSHHLGSSWIGKDVYDALCR